MQTEAMLSVREELQGLYEKIQAWRQTRPGVTYRDKREDLSRAILVRQFWSCELESIVTDT